MSNPSAYPDVRLLNQLVLDHSLSGGVTVNDVMMHAGVPNAPFGGVGESGYGYYHGRHGIDAFSHTRTVVAPPMWLDKLMSFRYPPFNLKNKSKIAVKNTLGFKRGETMEDQKILEPGRWSSWTRVAGVGLAMAYFVDAQFLAGRLRLSPALHLLGDKMRSLI